jgi:hypothetical protein
MYQTWSWLSFLHWSDEPAVVQRLLPERLEVQTFQGHGWWFRGHHDGGSDAALAAAATP